MILKTFYDLILVWERGRDRKEVILGDLLYHNAGKQLVYLWSSFHDRTLLINEKVPLLIQFRYLFVIDDECDVILDLNELSDYKWISIDDLAMYSNYGRTIKKLKDVLNINE